MARSPRRRFDGVTRTAVPKQDWMDVLTTGVKYPTGQGLSSTKANSILKRSLRVEITSISITRSDSSKGATAKIMKHDGTTLVHQFTIGDGCNAPYPYEFKATIEGGFSASTSDPKANFAVHFQEVN